ncbi:hypothetical protein NQ315_006569 [Exocentrus adspersus]|uniref:MADF domain-containing protein n=1 Tax=Exocentrus adspersus TaxID=1586481 RepID=A0AAV8VFX3_9CUCU|nr:hypothetical protein NQ315_006569 [Exocentrus adspersus]
MNNSKCVISRKTHRIVTFQGTNTPVIEEGMLLLYNQPANCVIRVPLTKTIRDMFNIVDTTNTNSCELDDQDEDNDGANNTLCAEDVVVECAGTPQSHQKIVKDTSIQIKERQVEETLTELLIAEYAKRPPLFNDRLPLIERSRSIKKSLELEVYHALNGQLTLEDITKKWAYLKKEYKKQKSILHKYVKSGCSYEEAATITGKTLWVHFLSLRFIDDHAVNSQTVSNIEELVLSPPLTSSSSSSTSEAVPVVSPLLSTSMSPHNTTLMDTPSQKKKRKITEQTSMIDGLIMQEMQKSHMDSTDHFCKMLCLEMKKLSARNKAILQIKYLELLNDMLNEAEC